MIASSLQRRNRPRRAAALAAAALLTPLAMRAAIAAPLPGDLDANGRVDVNDALLVLHSLVGIQVLSAAQMQAADLDGDGKITVHDVVLMLREGVGLDPRVLLTVDAPAPGAAFRTTTAHVTGHVTGPVAFVSIDGAQFPVAGGAFAADVPLVPGANPLTVSVRIPQGGFASVTVPVIQDSRPPALMLLDPSPGLVASASPVTVAGTASDESGPVTVTVNGASATLAMGAFSAPATLATGANTVRVVATDLAGNTTESDVSVTYFVSKPVQAVGADGTKVRFPAGSLPADLPVSVTPLAAADLAALPPAPFAPAPRASADPSHPAPALLGADRIVVGDGAAKLLQSPDVEACPVTTLKPGDPVLLTEMKPNPLRPGAKMLSLVDTMSVSADGRRILSDPIGPDSPFPGFARDTDALWVYDDAVPGRCHVKCDAGDAAKKALKDAQDIHKLIQNETKQLGQKVDRASQLKESLVGHLSDPSSILNSDVANLDNAIFSGMTLAGGEGKVADAASKLSTAYTTATTAGQIAQDLQNGQGSDPNAPLGNTFDTNVGNIGNLFNALGTLVGQTPSSSGSLLGKFEGDAVFGGVLGGAGVILQLVSAGDSFFKDLSQFQSTMQDIDFLKQSIQTDQKRFDDAMNKAHGAAAPCPDPPGVLDVHQAYQIEHASFGRWSALTGSALPSDTTAFLGVGAQLDALGHLGPDLRGVLTLSAQTTYKQAIGLLTSYQASMGAFGSMPRIRDQVNDYSSRLDQTATTYLGSIQSALAGSPPDDFFDRIQTVAPAMGALVATADGVFGALSDSNGDAILPLAAPGGTFQITAGVPGSAATGGLSGGVSARPPKGQLLDVGDLVISVPAGTPPSGSPPPAPTPAPEPMGTAPTSSSVGVGLAVDAADNTWLGEVEFGATGTAQLVMSRASDAEAGLSIASTLSIPFAAVGTLGFGSSGGASISGSPFTLGADGGVGLAYATTSIQLPMTPGGPVTTSTAIDYLSLPPGASQFSPASRVTADGQAGGALQGVESVVVLGRQPPAVAWYGSGSQGNRLAVVSRQAAGAWNTDPPAAASDLLAIRTVHSAAGPLYRLDRTSSGAVDLSISTDGVTFAPLGEAIGFNRENDERLGFGPSSALAVYRLSETDASAPGGGTDVQVALSMDGGKSFAAPVKGRIVGKFIATGEIVPDGRGGFAGLLSSGSDKAPLYWVRSIDGKTWSDPVAIGVNLSGLSSLVVDAKGNVTLAWAQPTPETIVIPGFPNLPGQQITVPKLQVDRFALFP